MVQKTVNGYFVYTPFKPLPIALVFESEDTLKTARSRYFTILTGYALACVASLSFFNSRSNEPDWWYTLAYSLLAVSIPIAYLVVYAAMPARTIYRPKVHGALVEP